MKKITYVLLSVLLLTALVACNPELHDEMFKKKIAEEEPKKVEVLKVSYAPDGTKLRITATASENANKLWYKLGAEGEWMMMDFEAGEASKSFTEEELICGIHFKASYSEPTKGIETESLVSEEYDLGGWLVRTTTTTEGEDTNITREYLLKSEGDTYFHCTFTNWELVGATKGTLSKDCFKNEDDVVVFEFVDENNEPFDSLEELIQAANQLDAYLKTDEDPEQIGGNVGPAVETSYTVTFVTGEDASEVLPQQIKPGETAVKPADPSKDLYDFIGWYTSTDYDAEWNFETEITKDVSIYAKFERTNYVIYDGNYTDYDKTAVPVDDTAYEANAEATVLATTLTRTGYTFYKWNTKAAGDGIPYDPDETITVNGHVTLYAQWNANKYTVTLDVNEGDALTDNDVEVSYDSAYGELPTPTRTGYDFVGWYTATTNGEEVDSNTTVKITDAQTLYAIWTIKKFSVTYHGNGNESGTVPEGLTDQPYGTEITVADNTGNLDMTTYSFAGWNTSADGKGTPYAGGATFNITDNVDLYAQWTNQFTVTYNKNNTDAGSTSANPSYVTDLAKNTKLTAPGEPTRKGYTFKGWYLDKNGNTAWNFQTDNVRSSFTLYAKWEINKYNLSYDKNNGSGTVPTTASQKEYLTELTVASASELSRTNYSFVEWNTSADGKGDSYDAGDVLKIEDDTTLYAIWLADSYDITYELNGGTNAQTNPAKYSFDTGVTSFANPTREGYAFKGWYSDTQFTTGNEVTAIASTATGAKTLYAKWAKVSNITYVLSGGTNAQSNPATYEEFTGVASFADPVRVGYAFRGWYSDADCSTGKEVTSIAATEVVDKTLYAKWAPIYTVTFNNNGGDTAANPATKDVEVGQTYGTLPEGLTRAHYSFGGWTTDKDSTDGTPAITAATTVDLTADQTLYAYWIIDQYTVTYTATGSDSGTVPAAPTKYDYNTTVTVLDNTGNLDQTGDKSLVGWQDASSKKYAIGSTFNIEADVTLSPVWSDKLTVVFDKNNTDTGSTSSKPSMSTDLSKNANVVKPTTDPTREGYNFVGWYKDKAGTTAWDFTNNGNNKVRYLTMEGGAYKLYAKWEEKDISLTYDGNGATGAPEKVTGKYWDKTEETWKKTVVTLPGVGNLVYTDEGHTFDGWNTKATGDGTSYAAGSTFTLTGDETLFAQWKANTYTITYHLNEGANGTNPTTYTYGTGVTSFADPTRQGYAFKGWYLDNQFSGDAVTEIGTTSIGNVDLYAKWAVLSNVKYSNITDANNTGNPTQYAEGYETALVSPTKAGGYAFKGWYLNSEYTGDAVTAISATSTGEVILYAKWVKTYTVSFDNNGGTGTTPTSITVEENGTYTALPSTDASKTGYTFDAWYTDADKSKGSKVTNESTVSNSNHTLYAQWTPNTYKVVFHSNDGNNTTTNQTLTYDKSEALSENTFGRKGYVFTGWATTSGGDVVHGDKAEVKNLISTKDGTYNLYAKWAEGYKVSFDLNYETEKENPSYLIISPKGNEKYSNLPSGLTRDNYSFDGWYTQATGGTKVGNDTKSVQSSAHTLYAHWKADEYTITYKDGGDTTFTGSHESGYPTKHTYDSATTLKSASKTGYEFGGWHTTSDCSDSAVTEIGAQDYTSAITLYAKWTPKVFKLNFNADGGTKTSTSPATLEEKNVTYDASYPDLPVVEKTGYTFGGWYNGNTKIEASATVKIEADTTVKAKWTALTPTISFTANGGTVKQGTTVTLESRTATYDQQYGALPEVEKTGYKFDGWYIGETEIKSTDIVKIVEDTALEAKWTANSYNISYLDKDGAAFSGTHATDKPEKHTYDSATTLKSASKTGYEFGGWYTTSACSGSAVTTLSATGYTADITLYAKWTANTYGITYKDGGNTEFTGTHATDKPENHTYDTATTLTSATKTGYTFGGWYTKSDCSDSSAVTTLSATGYTADITLYAKWTANTYDITYVLNNGANAQSNPNKYTYDIGVASFANPTRTGYTFGGWYSDSQFTAGNEVTTIASNATGAKTLYAKWTANSYSITYLDKDGSAFSGTHETGYPENHTYDTATTLKSASKIGYEFGGWYTTTDCSGSAVTEIGAQDYTSAITLYAKWTENHVTSIALNETTLSVVVGKTAATTLTATLEPTNLLDTNKTVTWSSENTNIATVADGVVTGVAIGSTTITVTADDDTNGTKTASCTVTVVADTVAVTGVTLENLSSYEVKPEKTLTLTATVAPANATNKNVTWESSTPAVATVADGVVTGVAAGQTTITVKTVDGSKTASCTVTVPTTYTVTYDGNGKTSGSVPTDSERYKSGEAITVKGAGDLLKTGYTFAGWKDADSTAHDAGSSFNAPAKDVTLTAQWTANKYTVIFIATQGSGTMNSQQFTYDAEATALSANLFTRTGYDFAGWANGTDSQATGYTTYEDKQAVQNLATSDSITLYALWTAKTYTVTFDVNGGKALTSNTKDYQYDSKYTGLPTPERTGYSFVNWHLDEVSGTVITATSDVKTAKDHTLVAEWTAKKFKLNFDADGGSKTADSPATLDEKNVTYDESYPALPVVEKTGYTFGGWYNGDTKIEASATVKIEENTTVKAKWTPIAVTGITLNETSKELKAGATLQLTATIAPTDALNKTVTWSSTDTSIATVSDSGYVTITSTKSKDERTVTITATASDATNGTKSASCEITVPIELFKVTYDGNGKTSGKVPTDSNYYASGETITVEGAGTGEDELKKTGYTFAGWKDADSNNRAAGSTFNAPAKNVTLTAQWTALTPTISFTANGGTVKQGTTVTLASRTATYDQQYGALPEVEKTGYTFDGWYIGETEIESTDIVKIVEDTALEAKWIANSYNISYLDKGGSEFSGKYETGYPTTHTYGTATTLKSASKTNYTFGGWYTTSDCSGSAVTTLSETGYTEDITLYAKWTKAVTGISISNSGSGKVSVGSTITLTAIINPKDATNKNVTWSSSDTSIATVDQNGVVTGVKKGSVTITVQAADETNGIKTATRTITVQ